MGLAPDGAGFLYKILDSRILKDYIVDVLRGEDSGHDQTK